MSLLSLAVAQQVAEDEADGDADDEGGHDRPRFGVCQSYWP